MYPGKLKKSGKNVPWSGNQHDTFKNLKESVCVQIKVDLKGVARDEVKNIIGRQIIQNMVNMWIIFSFNFIWKAMFLGILNWRGWYF